MNDKLVFTGQEVHGEYANLSYFSDFLTYNELLDCIDIKVLPETRKCIQGGVTEYKLNEDNQVQEGQGRVIWRSYGVTIIRDTLKISNPKFKGTEDKKFGVGVTFRLGIGSQPGDYHILDLPVG